MHACVSRTALNFFPVPAPNFGSWIRRRRLELGLSLTRAASLAGFENTIWEALEQGWIPGADEKVWRSLAATVEVRFGDLERFIAPVAAHFEAAQAL